MARVDRKTLAQRVRERRLSLGLTQKDVAGSDFTRGFISQIENGFIDPSLKSLEIIAQRLGTPVEYFLQTSETADPAEVLSLLREAVRLREEGLLDQAKEVAAKALSLAEQQSDPSILARAQRSLGWILYMRREYTQAAKVLEDASASYQRAGNLTDAAHVLNTAGTAWHNAKEMAKAILAYKETLKILEQGEIRQSEYQRVSVNLGLAYVAACDYAQAMPQLQRALKWARDNNDYYRLGDIHTAIGLIHKNTGRFEDAIESYDRARSIYNGVPDPLRYAHATMNCGNAYLELGQPEARSCFEQALATYEKLGERGYAAVARIELARLAWQEGRHADAEQLCGAALQDAATDRDRGRILLIKGRLHEKRNELAEAESAFKEGLSLLEESDKEAVDACYELGNLLLRLEKPVEASAYLAKAAAYYRNMTHPSPPPASPAPSR